jgi:hypothetical protein
MFLDKLAEIALTHKLLYVAGVSTQGRECDVHADLRFWVGYSFSYFIDISRQL